MQKKVKRMILKKIINLILDLMMKSKNKKF